MFLRLENDEALVRTLQLQMMGAPDPGNSRADDNNVKLLDAIDLNFRLVFEN
jgi:hypothetical protein